MNLKRSTLRPSVSKGAQALLEIIQQLYPYQQITLEYNVARIGASFIDIYLPRLQMGFEYDGIQHFKYNEHFHGSRDNFLKARRRDNLKDDLCKEQKIILIRVAYDEEMSRNLVLGKIEEALTDE